MAGRAALRVALVSVVCVFAVLGPTAANAACHSFRVRVSPSSVAEGGRVAVTIERDAAVNPSDVHVETIDESARAPADYTRLDEQVRFTNETERTLRINIANDAADEGAETFRVHLSDPGGCAVSPNFELGPDARVTIQASDRRPAAQQPAPPPAAPAPATAAATTAQASPTTTSSPMATTEASPSPSPTGTFEPFAQPEGEEDGGLPALAIVGIVLGALAAATGGAVLWYRHRAGA